MRRLASAVAAAAAAAAAGIVMLLSACAEPAPTVTHGPPAFPRVAGRVLSTTEPAKDDWRVVVRTEHLSTAYVDARALLVDAGYELTQDNDDSPTGGAGQACTTAHCVGFVVVDDPTVGPSVQYEVFHSTGFSG